MIADDVIPISTVVHFVFCPRRAWLESQGEQVDSYPMEVGGSDHSRIDSEVSYARDEAVSVSLRSDRLGLAGKTDVVRSVDGGVVLREYKATPVRSKASVTQGMRVQLALQWACLDEMGEHVTGAEVYFTSHNLTLAVDLSADDRAFAEKAVAKTRETVLSEQAPEPIDDDRQCANCSHVDICLPDEKYLRPVRRRIKPPKRDKRVVNLISQGSYAHLKKGRMLIECKDADATNVPLETVQAVRLQGNINLSGGLVKELLRRDIPVQWCTATGQLVGWSVSSAGPNGLTRQLQHLLSHEGCLPLAREFISAKIANQATQLRRSGTGTNVVNALRTYQHACDGTHDLRELLGIEGRAAALYFAHFLDLIKEGRRDRWGWEGRTRRPATDPINSMLNYAYAMLMGDEVRAIIACGLDPHAGFLHSSSRNKPALALDLMEEMRAPVADSVVQTVVNCQMIGPNDFTFELGGVRMNAQGRRTLAQAYSRRMSTEIVHPVFQYKVTWERALEIQARQILAFLEHSQDRYQGIRVR